eukprot:TRINITY_DN391_c0_g1_i2.p1 TRINITY_DN391_c0_g1~~TRINITY_DN391_c0_g1_i2.p1  ORF type:complete len:138 (-),score=41.28 TRINITY_DN391_c0_g1_i2:200-613(-)
MSFEPKFIDCRDCGKNFEFTAGEQEFYAEKGLTNEPTRCMDCRRAKKAARGGRGGFGDRNSGDREGGYNRDRSYGGGYGGGRDRPYGDRESYGDRRGGYGGGRGGRGGFGDRPPREDHPAVCDQCKADCTVPFRPNW